MTIRYEIEGDRNDDVIVPVKLVKDTSGEIKLLVGGWVVFALKPNGAGRLSVGIPSNSREGLKAKDGRLAIEE